MLKERGERLPVQTYPVLGVPIAKITMPEAIATVNSWADEGSHGHLVTFANVHMIIEAQQNPKVRDLLQSSSMNCPDGNPLFWIGRHRFANKVSQVAGPDFMPLFCSQGREKGHRHYLYGGAPGVVQAAAEKLQQLYPGIQIVGVHTPPFRALNEDEDEAICRSINQSDANFVWVCLGCPKQELWMQDHRQRLTATALLGVGQAIDILAGTRKRAPELIRQLGLEWFYRFLSEPQRLWKRYLSTNFLFIVGFMREALLRARE